MLVVRAEHREAIPGIVHGSSASGASLYLEPLSTVELNNDVVGLAEREREEIHRILLALTNAFRLRPDDVETTIDVAADFDELLKIVRAALPATPLVVIGTKPSPKRWAIIDQQRALNRLLAERCMKDGHATFLDVEKPMLDANGKPKLDLFRDDNLHLNAEGYKLWTTLLAPHLTASAVTSKP